MTDLLAITIVGANGDLLACDEHTRPYRLGPGPALFGLPPIESPEMPAAGLLAGSMDGRARYGARALRIRLIVDCDTDQELLEALQRLGAAVSPVIPGTTRGRNCQVIVTRPDGDVRSMSARYTGGLSVHKFTKVVTYERLTRRASREIAPVISRVCREEGMIGHALTGEVRVKRYEGAN